VLKIKLGFSDLIFTTTLLLALSLGQQMLSLDSDLGRHLALGNFMLDERVIPTRDLLSHTRAGLSRPPYEWLSQILFASTHRLLGLDGVILFTSLVIASTLTLVYRYALHRSESALVAMAFTFIAVGASSIHWLSRPHVLTFLLLAIWIELLDRLTRGKSVRLHLLPLIMLLWVNLHGGFIYGILVWIAYLGGWLWKAWRGKAEGKVRKKLLFVGISSLFATVITPDLWHNWEAVLNNRSAFILNRTVETMRPNLTDPSVLPYTLLLILTILLFAKNWKNMKAGHFFLLAGLGVMSLLMARNIPLFAIAAAPILSGISAGSLSNSRAWTRIEDGFSGFGQTASQSIWSYAVALLAILFFVNFSLKNGQPVHRFDPTVFPVEAVNFIEENPQQGNMFNEFNWGGYLLYRLWPQYTVFLDSQSDFYGESLIRDYDQIMSADGDWQNLMDKYQVDWAIIPAGSPLAKLIESAPDWRIVYKDSIAMIGRRQ
jgi:hypothetical protein